MRPDFSLIWGADNAPFTPIEASDYTAGWVFRTGAPPRRVNFDYFQNLSDQRTAWLGEQMLLAVGHEWQDDVTYDAYAVVRSPVNGQLYRSLVGSNLNNEPSVSGSQWALGVGSIADASTTAKGIVELATQAETLALADSARAVTPASLAPLFGTLRLAHVVAVNTNVPGVNGANIRPLNTVQLNTIAGASLAANQITLPAGSYEIDGYGICTANAARTYLYNVTDAANAVIGASVGNNNAADSELVRVDGVFTVPAGPAKVFELRHQLGAVNAATGMGRATNLIFTEVYAAFRIKRIG